MMSFFSCTEPEPYLPSHLFLCASLSLSLLSPSCWVWPLGRGEVRWTEGWGVGGGCCFPIIIIEVLMVILLLIKVVREMGVWARGSYRQRNGGSGMKDRRGEEWVSKAEKSRGGGQEGKKGEMKGEMWWGWVHWKRKKKQCFSIH